MPSLAIPFTLPILPRGSEGGGPNLPRDTNADSPDGYFQVEATYTNEESGGNPVDYSGVVDAHSDGHPSDALGGPDTALIDNLGFRGSMLGLSIDPPPIRLGVKQTAPADLPDYATVDIGSVSADFVVERWANYDGTELIEFNSAGFTEPPVDQAVSNLEVYSTAAQTAGAFATGIVAATFSGEAGWGHLQEGIAEIATAKAGELDAAGFHEVRYIGMVVHWELLPTVPYRRISNRGDGRAGGARRVGRPPKTIQGSNRRGAGAIV